MHRELMLALMGRVGKQSSFTLHGMVQGIIALNLFPKIIKRKKKEKKKTMKTINHEY